jgi:acyl-CoA oxidase
MITQQVAGYLIKKVRAAVEDQHRGNGGDEMDVRFREFVREKRAGGSERRYNVLHSDCDIVKSFESRATALVCWRIHQMV